MRQPHLALMKFFCATAMALASSACGGGEGPDSGPGLDIERSAVGAPLQGSSESCPEGPRSFSELKGSLEDLPVDCVPSWTEAQLSDGFEAIRDTRLQALALPEQPDFPRRIPWLEPENGCEERAPAAVYILHDAGYPTPWYARVQSRENAGLTLVTENEPDGSVSWSHHVAPVVRVGGQLMILDPAIDPGGPLPIAQWLSHFVAGPVDMAVCRDDADEDGCFDAVPAVPSLPSMVPSQGIRGRLITEWRVQELLGRDPYRVLGDCPPWGDCPPEPAPNPSLPPTISRFASDRDVVVWYPLYVIGDNFVEGLTTVRIVGNGIDALAPISRINKRRILIEEPYPSGVYQVTASNGAHASQTVTVTID